MQFDTCVISFQLVTEVGIAYDELDVDDIDTAREYQKICLEAIENKLLKQFFDCQSRGNFKTCSFVIF